MAKYKPFASQKIAINKMTENKEFLLFGGIGSGKTSMMLATLKQLKDSGEILKEDSEKSDHVLIVAPKNVCLSVWEQEANKWDDFNNFSFTNFSKMKNNEITESLDSLSKNKPQICVINYESLNKITDYFNQNPEKKKSWPFKTVIFDEVHTVKNGISKSLTTNENQEPSWHHNYTKNFFNKFRLSGFMIDGKLSPLVERCYGLTGTPTPNSLSDIYSISKMVLGNKSPFVDINSFYKQYMIAKTSAIASNGVAVDSTYEAKPDAHKNITHALENYAIYLDNSDRLMPQITYGEEICSLPKDAKEVYHKLENIYDDDLTSTKLIQCASGHLYDDKRKDIHVHSKKDELVMKHLENLGDESCLIIYNTNIEQKHLADMIKERYGKSSVVTISGDRSKDNITNIIDNWNEGKYKALLLQPKAGASGLNLQNGGHDVLIYSSEYNAEPIMQGVGRVYRTGQKNDVTVTRLVAKDTIDEEILENFNKKGINQNEFLSELKLKLPETENPNISKLAEIKLKNKIENDKIEQEQVDQNIAFDVAQTV